MSIPVVAPNINIYNPKQDTFERIKVRNGIVLGTGTRVTTLTATTPKFNQSINIPDSGLPSASFVINGGGSSAVVASNDGFVTYTGTPYQSGTASQLGVTVTGVGTNFVVAMVGGMIVWLSGQSAIITTFGSATSLFVAESQTVPSGPFIIYYNASGSSNFSVDANGLIFAQKLQLDGTAAQITLQPNFTGNPIVITASTPGQPSLVTIPDPGSITANFVLNKTGTSQTIAGSLILTSALSITPATNQLLLGAAGHVVTINSPAIAAAAQTVTLPDSTQANTNLLQSSVPIITANVSRAINLTTDPGALIGIDSSGGAVALTLPAVATAIGTKYRIYWKVAGANSTVAAGTAVLMGNLLNGATVVPKINLTTITFVTVSANLGDYVEVWSDGVKWQLFASTTVAGGITIA